MNKCQCRDLECPFALSEDSPLPCFATQEQCDAFLKQREDDKKIEIKK